MRVATPAGLLFLPLLFGCDSPTAPGPVGAPGDKLSAEIGASRPVPVHAVADLYVEFFAGYTAILERYPIYDAYFTPFGERSLAFTAVPWKGPNPWDGAFEDTWQFSIEVPNGRLNNPDALIRSVLIRVENGLRQHLKRHGYLD